jgi:bifunctional ADP-heptose synthase (sugar kinase/adenylyltransferase)
VIDGRLRYKKSLSEDIIVDTEAENMEEYINALKITPNY